MKATLSPKQLSGQIIWVIFVVLLGIFFATNFSSGIFGAAQPPNVSSQVEAGVLDEPAEAPPRLQIAVRQNGLIVEASVSGASDVVWKNRLLDPGDWCDASTFALTPNHPAVHHSHSLVIPESATSQNFYRNKWLCFQVIAVDATGRKAKSS